MHETQQFYDGIAENYQFIYADWAQSVRWQGDFLTAFFSGLGITPPQHILDCTCGIGTQAIALALKGYHVHGTDLSPKEIEQAQYIATRFKLPHPVTFEVADLLDLPQKPTQYNLVMAFDNPIAHFHTEADLLQAFTVMASQTKNGGVITTSLRDYDNLIEKKPNQSPVSVTHSDGKRRIMFQVWDWLDDSSGYHAEMFVLMKKGNKWQTTSHKTQMRAWQRADVTRILQQAGLGAIQWHMPDDSGFYQPIVTARK